MTTEASKRSNVTFSVTQCSRNWLQYMSWLLYQTLSEFVAMRNALVLSGVAVLCNSREWVNSLQHIAYVTVSPGQGISPLSRFRWDKSVHCFLFCVNALIQLCFFYVTTLSVFIQCLCRGFAETRQLSMLRSMHGSACSIWSRLYMHPPSFKTQRSTKSSRICCL